MPAPPVIGPLYIPPTTAPYLTPVQVPAYTITVSNDTPWR
jgi:hypothetical protein